ncbi:MAG: FkbM family methyltransferase [Planctomycetes bacterium]|nr:FkbM family methyltransferase [Planctomycetota bacterium]
MQKAIYDRWITNHDYYCDKRLLQWQIPVGRYMRFRKRWLTDMNIQTVVDVGANIGEFSAIAASLFPMARIYAFEPITDCVESIKQKQIPNVTIYQNALGNHNGEAKFYISSWNPSSSLKKMSELHKQNWPHTAENISTSVEARRLDSFEAELDLKQEILVKVDIQGAEIEFIDGAKNTLSKAKVIIIEAGYVQLYEDEAMFDGVYNKLKELGFSFRGVLKQSQNKMDDSYLQADFIFVK